jgi:hypothetical protein
MKVLAVLFVVLAVASAFAPVPAGRASTELKKSLFDTVSLVKMDVGVLTTHILLFSNLLLVESFFVTDL